MKKILFLLALLLTLPATIMAAPDSWVKLDATNFPDANFRAYLLAECKVNPGNNKWAIDPAKYDESTNEINRDMITEVDINFQNNSSYHGVNVQFQKIASLEGIKLLRNVTTIGLPVPSAKNRTTSLKSLDVSGMIALETITNYSSGTGGFPYKVSNTGAESISPASGFVCPITKVIAENCPRLREVRLSAYTSLQEVSFKGSNNIVNLYIVNTGITSLDISNLTKLFNEKTTSSYIDQDFDEAMNMSGYPNDAMKLMVTFSTVNCKNLKTLNLGDVNIHFLDVSGCNQLEYLDLSGQKDLFRLYVKLSYDIPLKGNLSYDDNIHGNSHNGRNTPTGALKAVKFGPKRIVKMVKINGAQFKTIDLSTIANTVQELDLSSNNLQAVDVASLMKATQIDLSNNRIRVIDLPGCHALTKYDIGWNIITYMPQFAGKYPYLTAYTSPFQIMHLEDLNWRVKIFDDPTDAQYFMTTTDTSTNHYYYAPKNCRIGDPEKDEYDGYGNPTGQKQDPCYLYFFNTDEDAETGIPTSYPRMEAFYYYSNRYTASSKSNNRNDWAKVYVCRHGSVPDEIIDLPKELDYYLAGDFNYWNPTERDKFVYDADQKRYYLKYTDNTLILRNFRVWGIDPDDLGNSTFTQIHDGEGVYTGRHPAEGETFYKITDATVSYGGHDDDYPTYTGFNSHVLFTPNIYHKMDAEDQQQHYTTYVVNPPHQFGQSGYQNASLEMRIDPLNPPVNYLLMRDQSTVGINNVSVDAPDNSNALVEYYDLMGRRVTPGTPGLYIRRQGTETSKVYVR